MIIYGHVNDCKSSKKKIIKSKKEEKTMWHRIAFPSHFIIADVKSFFKQFEKFESKQTGWLGLCMHV